MHGSLVWVYWCHVVILEKKMEINISTLALSRENGKANGNY